MCSILMLGLCLSGAPHPGDPVVYHEGFEKDKVSWRCWAKNHKVGHQVHFVGTTTEKAYKGNRSLKIDLTFEGGTYNYWGTGVRIPAAGDLRLSGYLLVDRLPRGHRVGLGYNILLPPSSHSGCNTFGMVSKPTGQWKRFEVSLADAGDLTAQSVLGTGDVYRYVDLIAVMFYGPLKRGERVVVYVDELTVTGHAPKDYEKSLADRVRARQEHLRRTARQWQTEAADLLKRIESARASADKLHPSLRTHADATAQHATVVGKQYVAQCERWAGPKARWPLVQQRTTRSRTLVTLRQALNTLGALGAYAPRHPEPYILYVRSAITDDPMRPRELPVKGSVGDAVRLRATPGEYESGTFAIFAGKDLSQVRLEPTALRGPAGVVPADAVDLHVVKVWYQAGIGTIGARGGQRVLVPELLLKDDDLIRVDTQAKRNLMRHTTAAGQVTYVDISDPDPQKMPDVRPQDAKTLQPFDVPAQSLKQIWITVRVPHGTAPGPYKGTIHVRPNGQPASGVHLTLDVLPFTLEPTWLVQSIYYRAKLGPNRHAHAVNSEYKTEKQLEAELRNMWAHGLTHPSTYQGYGANLERVLAIRRRVGFGSGPLFTLGQGCGGQSADPDHLRTLQAGVRRWIKLAKQYGHDSVYFYGADEATGERLKRQRPAWKATRDAGGKTFVAGYRGSFEIVGDLQDVLVFAGRPDPKYAAKYHGIGHRIFSYANPQCGCEQPERYRRNFGLLLWKSNFDGAMDYAYQHSFTHVWNDFDNKSYRDHVMAYPTMDGVIDTLQWEGYREGVDDTRYLATLRKALDAAARSDDPQRNAIGAQAKEWLNTLDIDGDLDAIRTRMIDWILKLRS